ncbi:SLATT domain-containing protein [Aeromicrobium sp. 179-A 4D2 NHS]|uniref:SLATT domain-containing protein n=1 Tax=Aeromicrobium sp. 179-A 4D2 NHS TaxID=3142375 RepID=UPI0039A23897
MWWQSLFKERQPSQCHGATDAVEDPGARDYLKIEESRAFKTYRARESAARRLGQRARAWNGALVAFSTSTAVASVGLLVDPNMYGSQGDTLMVCLSVLVLVVSLTTANIDYSGRSRNMFLNYRNIQRIAVEMEELGRQTSSPVTRDAVRELVDRYQAVLDETENHTPGDHLRNFSRTLPQSHPHYSSSEQLYRERRRRMLLDWSITVWPYVTLVVPVALLVPLVAGLWG